MYRHISSMKCKLQLYKCNVVLLLIVEEKITPSEKKIAILLLTFLFEVILHTVHN